MPDWTAPFKLPKFSDDKFEKAKASYNKKHGYAVTVPAFDDVIQLVPFKPLTDRETIQWTGNVKASEIPSIPLTVDEIDTWIKTKKGSPPKTRRPTPDEQKIYKQEMKNQIPYERREEIRGEKQRKKDRFLAMLASPSPKILRSAGSIMVALDNAQDAISTLACIGMIAGLIAGGTTAALLAGPVGLLIGAAALLNLLNPMSRLKGGRGGAATGRAAKKQVEQATDRNPFSKKSRGKLLEKMKKFRPGQANAIEALQVTQNIFGVGISIGPLMGLAQDAVAGVVRQWTGEKVIAKTTPPRYPDHVRKAMLNLKTTAVFEGYEWHSAALEESACMIAANLALQVVTPYLADWHPVDEIEDVADVMVDAPRPTDPLTLEIIQEAGKTLDQVCNWPQTGEKSISLGDLNELTAPIATKNLEHFAEQNKNSPLALIAVQAAHDFALGSIEAIEGPGHVDIEYSHTERILLIILDNGWCYPDDITPAQIQKFEDWVYVHEYMDTQPSGADIWRYAEVFCGFTWAKSPDETR